MDFAQAVKKFTKAEVYKNHSLVSHTGYGVGGNADFVVKIKSAKDLKDCIEFAKDYSLNYKVIGKGTNLLFSDRGFKGAIILTEHFNGIRNEGKTLKCSAGVKLVALIERLNYLQIDALNALYGIPATVGGAVVMNAGSFGGSISEYIHYVDILKDDKLLRLDKADCQFRYRGSRFLDKSEILLSVSFDLDKMQSVKNCYNREWYLSRRKAIQPSGKSCGSVFKNPKGDYAGRLIEQSGLKGYNVGGAKISELHANFIVTNEKATATDVYRLIKHVKKIVKEKFGLTLTQEIEIIGEF